MLDQADAVKEGRKFEDALKLYLAAGEKARALKDQEGEARALEYGGYCCSEMAQHLKALGYFEQALALYRSTGDRAGERRTLLGSKEMYLALGKREKAIECFQQLLAAQRAWGDKEGEAQSLLEIGLIYSNNGQKWIEGQQEKALQYWQKSLEVSRSAGIHRVETYSLFNIGNYYLTTPQPEKAVEYYEKALPGLRALGDKRAEGAALNNLGNVAHNSHQLEKAREYYQKALLLYRAARDKKWEARMQRSIGGIYSATGASSLALPCFEKAVKLYQSLTDKDKESEFEEAEALFRTAEVYDSLGFPRQALAQYDGARKILHELGNRRGEVEMLTHIGMAYMDLGQKLKAREHFQKALLIYRGLGEQKYIAALLVYVGDTYPNSGSPSQALALYEQALKLYHGLDNTDKEVKDGVAHALSNMGVVYFDTGSPRMALDYYEKARELYHEANDQRMEALMLTNTGICFAQLGQLQKALGLYLQSLDLHRSLGNRIAEAGTLRHIGNLYRDSGQSRSALAYHQQAQALVKATGSEMEALLFEEIATDCQRVGNLAKAIEYYQKGLALFAKTGNRAEWASELVGIGTVHALMGQSHTALKYFLRALPVYRLLRSENEAEALNNIGYVYSKLGQRQRALRYFRQALRIYRAGAIGPQATVLRNMGEAYASENDLQHADALFRQAISLAEEERSSLGGLTEAKLALQQYNGAFYASYLNFLVKAHRGAEAFDLQQKMKSRALLDMVSGGTGDLLSRLTDQERTRLAELRTRANDLNRRMIAEGVRNEKGSRKRFEGLQKELRQIEEELSRYTDTLYALHPDLARAAAPHTATAPEAARGLPPDTALLEYSVLHPEWATGTYGIDRVCLLVVTSDGRVRAPNLNITTSRLASLVSRFRAACIDPRKGYEADARRLYRALIGPVVKQLNGKRRLIICPDGPLWDVPFAALMVGKQFLADRFEIAYGYSATGVQASLAAKDDRRRKQPERTAMVVADPAFGGGERFGDVPNLPGQRPIPAASRPIPAASRPIPAASRPIPVASRQIAAALILPRAGKLSALKGTRLEAEAIRRDFPDTAAFLGEDAQEETVKKEAGKYRYLHFATHGFFNQAAPMLSSIVLAEPPAGSSEDGFLTAREIFDMRLSADMVVLSACNTARGEKRGGEGIVGMSWALFVAGVPTQVLSQWAVDDSSTATLMERFYTGIRRNESKSQALTEAERALRNDGKHRHPYYWAPFVLMGDWR